MAKKRQTTGAPKAKPKTAASESNAKPKEGSRAAQRSRAEREALIQRRILRGTAALAVIIILVVAVAFLVERVIIPDQAVASVNGEKITVGEYQPRVRLERALDIDQINTTLANYASLFGDVNTAHEQLLQNYTPYATWWKEVGFDSTPDVIGLRVLNDMIDDRLIAEKAKELGITVTEEDIQAQINKFFGYDPEAIAARELEPTATTVPSETPTPFVSPTPSSTPTSTPTPDAEATEEPTATIAVEFPTALPSPTLSSTEVADQYSSLEDNYVRQLRRNASLSQADVDAYFEQLALREAVRDAVTPEITTMLLHVDARHILVDTEEEALDILDALNAGESFSDLARTISTDTGSGAEGGELGWTPILNYVTAFADAVRDAPIGEFYGPVKTEYGYHIVQVRAREEREITEDQMVTFKEYAFQQWLQDLRDSEGTSIETYSAWTSNVPSSPEFVYNPPS
jgi:cell division septation protein DedD